MFNKLVPMLAGASALALVALPANALVSVMYDVAGGGFTTCNDGDACDLNAGADAVLLTIAGFGSIHITQGSATQGFGAESIHLTVQNNSVPGPASGDITILVSGTNFTTNTTPQAFVSNSSATALQNVSVDFASWADDGNTLFAQTCAIETGATLNGVGLITTPGSCATTGSYSLTQQMILHVDVPSGGQGAVNLIMSTDAAIPEPLTTALLGAGLLGLAGLRLRRQA
jgi:hypothetical protein